MLIFGALRVISLKMRGMLQIFSDMNGNKEIVFFDVYGIHLRWTGGSSFSYMSSPRPNHGLMYIMCDEVKVEYKGGGQESFYKGNIVYMPRELMYSVRFLGSTDCLEALLVNFSADENLPRCDRIKVVTRDADAGCVSRFRKIIDLYTQTKNYTYSVMAEFYALLGKLTAEAATDAESSALYQSIAPAIVYIDSHIGDKLYVPELARLCFLCESTFRKRFEAVIGRSPVEYISDLKLEKARELLKSSDIPIALIVSQLGFCDTPYFSKLFKHKYGVTPSRFRG